MILKLELILGVLVSGFIPLSSFIHEHGHAFTAQLFGYRSRLYIGYWSGRTHYSHNPNSLMEMSGGLYTGVFFTLVGIVMLSLLRREYKLLCIVPFLISLSQFGYGISEAVGYPMLLTISFLGLGAIPLVIVVLRQARKDSDDN
jgi:hypothetical protein